MATRRLFPPANGDSVIDILAWSQATAPEWRSFHLANKVGGARRSNLSFPVISDKTATERCQSSAATPFSAPRLDQTSRNAPPGEAIITGPFYPAGHSLAKAVDIQLDTVTDSEGAFIEVTLIDGVDFTQVN